MTPIKNQQVISANGQYTFEAEAPGRDCVIEWCIAEGGSATVIPGYVNLDGGFSPARDISGAVPSFGPEGGCCLLPVPTSGMLALDVADADSLSMKVSQTRRVP